METVSQAISFKFFKVIIRASIAATLLLVVACGGGGGGSGTPAPTTPTTPPAPTTSPAPATPTTPATPPTTLARPDLANVSAASNFTAGTRASAILFTNNGGGALTGCTVSPALPTGLNVSRSAGSASCQITGIPSVVRGRTTYTVTATNASGADATPATVSITVVAALARPNLANASAVSLTVGTRASAILFTNNGGGALTGCTVSPTLPTGLDVSRTTGNGSCQITGTPSVTRGRTTYRVTATNATGADTTPATVAITVMAAPVVLARPNLANASAASLTAGTRASAILFTNNGGGGLTGCTVSPTLPTGLDVSRTTGNASCQITGRPTAVRSRTTYTVTATNATGNDTATVSITVNPALPDLANATAATLVAGTEITTIAFTNNGGGGLTGCLVNPMLPTGLNLSLTGDNGSCRITGTPDAVTATDTYTVTATNATGADATPATVSITVNPALPDLADATANLTTDTDATITFVNNGGGVLTGCTVNPTLPTGLSASLTGDNGSCRITGRPTTAQTAADYIVTATNATGEDATPATVSITVAASLAQPDLASAAAATLVVGTKATITFANNGGRMLTGCAVDKTLPTGLALDRTSGNGSCEITGTPDAVTATATYTVTATNAMGADATPATVSITVNPARPSLANAAAATLVVGTQATAILFTNSGGGYLTPDPAGCTVNPPLPAGLDVAVSGTTTTATCQITGNPSAVDLMGTTYTVTATNVTGSDMATVSITVNPALPNLANATAATLVAGTEITTIAFTNNGGGGLTGCLVNPPLPTGLNLSLTDDNGSCRITGTPDTVTATTTYRVTASNATGADSTPATVSILVNPARPSLADAPAATLVVGTDATIIFTNNGGGMLTGCAVDKTLPTGLSLDPTSDSASCEITGTPSAVTAVDTYTVTATNASGADSTPATVSILVNPALPDLANAAAASLVAGTEITAITFANNGGGMLTGCAVDKTLPTGLSLDPTSDSASCEITGTPDAATAVDTYTVTATNATGADATPATVSILVNPARPDLANASAASFIAGTEITAITFANNGGGALTNCGVNPPLPNGLDASPTDDSASCEITGTPTAVSGTTTYTITAINATGSDMATVSITVNPALPNLANATAATLTVGTEATISFTNSGGGALTNCAVDKPLPAGLSASLADGNASCRITGTPDAVTATDTYRVTATNVTGADATPATVSITVNPALPDLANAAANLTTGTDATITFVNNGGGALTNCAVSPPLPTGLDLDRTNDNTSCEIIGRPTTAQTAADYIVTATNATGEDATPATVSITVVASLAQPDLAAASAATLVVGTKATISFSNNGGRMLTGCTVDKTLPTGLALGRTSGNGSCEITGTPDAVTATATYRVTATNATGADATPATVSITVNPARPSLADATAVTFIAGTEITAITFANSGGGYLTPDPAGCTVNPPLPAGLDVAVSGTTTTATCQITGNPSAVDLMGTTYTVTATNATGSDMATVSILVNPARPSLIDPTAATLAVGTDATITFANSGGGHLSGCSVDTTLPAGLTLSLTDGNGSCRITGNPSVVSSRATYTVTATNVTGSDTADVSILVNPARPSLADATAVTFIAGTEITAITFANSGGGYLTPDPAGCTVNPPLPAGLDVMVSGTTTTATCQITGNPSAVDLTGTTYTVTATNATGDDTADVSITVNPLLPILANVTTVANLTANVDEADIEFTNSGGGHLTDCMVAPDLPTGLAVAVFNTGDAASCEITGTPTVVSASSFYTVTASNVTGDSAGAIVVISVAPPAPDLAATSAILIVGAQAIIDITNNGGGFLNPCTVSPPLPDGLQVSRTEDNASCRITGTPDAVSLMATPYTVTTSNATGNSNAVVTITVNPLRPSLADAAAVSLTASSIPLSLTAGADAANIEFANSGGGYLTDCAVSPDLPAGLAVAVSGTETTATCSITGIPTAAVAEAAYTVTATNVAGNDPADVTITVTVIDADGDGLIDISTLEQLDDVRYSLAGTGYQDGSGAAPNSSGCPLTGCFGYELMNDLTFDADGDGSTWTRQQRDGSITLDAGDNNDDYFDIAGDGSSGGWVPIGDCGADGVCGSADDAHFTAVFEGHGHTITGLATRRDIDFMGLFGYTSGAEIRNLGLIDNLASGVATRNRVGGLVGFMSGGSIVTSYATGDVASGTNSSNRVGGLVGHLDGGEILASHASGDVDGGTGDGDRVGGLVGWQGGTIIASYASGDVDGGAGADDRVGGLVGWQDGAIIASHATGDVDGGAGHSDNAGGLVGWQDGGTITASYAAGDADGGDGGLDIAGSLTGSQPDARVGTVVATASWGFGGTAGWENSGGSSGSADRPVGITSPEGLTDENVPAAWNAAVSNTLGIWNLSTGSQPPMLAYADYDGVTMGRASAYASGHLYHCASDSANAPAGALLIPDCGKLIPAVAAANVMAASADINVVSGAAGTAYVAVLADGATAPAAAAIKAAVAGSGGVVAAGNGSAPAGGRGTVSLTGLGGETRYNAYIVVESGSASNRVFGRVMRVDLLTLRTTVDTDDDGLIEISTLEQLNNMRHSLGGSGYKTSGSATAITAGCPSNVCRGYELMADLTFDADGDGSTWRRNADGSVTLDTDDDNDAYFDMASDGSSGGWVPIGDSSNGFTTVFEGNGNTITGLATVRDLQYIGLFGYTSGAEIRNLGLIGSLAKHNGNIGSIQPTNPAIGGLVGEQQGGAIVASYAAGEADGGLGNDYVGGLVGQQNGGAITASHASGDADGGAGNDHVGGLAGWQRGGAITASHATGDADGGVGNDNVGGLVGTQVSSAITASHATGDVGGGTGDGGDFVGGLVGRQNGGTITASYATGDADGGTGDEDNLVGGLVGDQTNSTITASYASGDVDGGAGNDGAGGLVGFSEDSTITASWGFGTVTGETPGTDGNTRPNGVTSASDLSSVNAGSAWNAAASNTLGAWDFGTASQPPALNHADYDGTVAGMPGAYTGGHLFHCARDFLNAPDTAILIPNCNTLIPAVSAANLAGATADINVISAVAGTAFVVVLADGATAPTAATIKAAVAGSGGVVAAGNEAVTAGGRVSIGLTGLEGETGYNAYIVVESDGVLGRVMRVDLLTPRTEVDEDNDGLIDIYTLEQLNNVRYSLGGRGYKTSATATAVTTGCPDAGCIGYELMNDLTFDADGDGSTWRRNRDGSVTLDTGDDNIAYFDIAGGGSSGGWVPIGTSSGNFTAVFEGNGHTITGLATARGLNYIGLFGRIAGAEIRNLGLVGNLARYSGSSDTDIYVGGLVGVQGQGSIITASYATGDADGGDGGTDHVGGLVGYQHTGTTITASYATGNVDSGAGNRDRVGGLVGRQNGGAITASYATGDVSGGGGNDDQVGGLVGFQWKGTAITASYATGDVDGGAGDRDRVGGLVGTQNGTITASWATGNADGGTGNTDQVGGLVGTQQDGTPITASYAFGDVDGGAGDYDYVDGLVGLQDGGAITFSWGFGARDGERTGSRGNSQPNGVSSVTDLTLSRARGNGVWNLAASNTLGAWNFGTDSQPPRLNYADYDGPTSGTAPSYSGGHRYHCASDAANAPDHAILIPGCTATLTPLIPGQYPAVDTDDDGLIEISTLEQLNNVRHSLDGSGYKTSASDIPNTNGCPDTGCIGYELIADLTFDADGDGSTWTRDESNGIVTLDAGDHNDTYFDIVSLGTSTTSSTGGWMPIGNCGADGICGDDSSTPANESLDDAPFTAVFEGNGHAITGLATVRNLRFYGLFGYIDNGEIRNLGLVDNFAVSASATGSYAHVGGLAGRLDDGTIAASYATGDVFGSITHDRVGGLVGDVVRGVITASYATGDVAIQSDSTANDTRVGGLVGRQDGGTIRASYATGNATGGGYKGGDYVGGLVGWQINTAAITASYATGDADGGTGVVTAIRRDRVGRLVGFQASGAAITASWGFGDITGEISNNFPGPDGSDRPNGVMAATDLTAGNAGDDWNSASRGTLGAWSFASGQAPALSYADYDDSGNTFHCAGASNPPAGTTLISNCGKLIPAHAAPANLTGTRADITVISGTTGTAYVVVLADGASAPTAAAVKAAATASGAVTAGVRATIGLTGLNSETDYNAYIVVESDGGLGGVMRVDLRTLLAAPDLRDEDEFSINVGQPYRFSFVNNGGGTLTGCAVVPDLPGELAVSPTIGETSCEITGTPTVASVETRYTVTATNAVGDDPTPATVFITVVMPLVDADGDGLIEISTLEQLNNMRHSLDGTGYKTSAGATKVTSGCPSTGCIGYELMNDLTFDADGDGSTWTRDPITGAVTLDSGDTSSVYFGIASDGSSGGWVPIGTSPTNSFTAVFEGNGHTITGLAIVRDLGYIGLFGRIDGTDIRNLGLVGNLARHSGAGHFGYVGGLVGLQDGGAISASYATGDVDGGAGNYGYVGGLVGRLIGGGTIIASYATGDVDGGTGGLGRIGGLVGLQDGGAITVSYATGDVDGGAGDYDSVGGLVGRQTSGNVITASYATGDVNGGTGSQSRVGGLVGWQDGSAIAASYATGDVDGGAGDENRAGGLVGLQSGTATITASWGFGSTSGELGGVHGSDDLPDGVTSTGGLASATVPVAWNAAASNTDGAWNFGAADQSPVLRYADYDGDGTDFHCASDAANAHDDALLILNCGTEVPGQGLTRRTVVPLHFVDADGDGLIEVSTLEQLNNVRHSLDGIGYRDGPGVRPVTTGCPTGCIGYELTADLTFDANGNGSTWTRSGATFTLDTGDDNSTYFDIASGGVSGGWVPIGSSGSTRFTAVFEGNGHTITGLATVRDLEYIGLFGVIGTDAEIRNLGLVGNLAKCTRRSDDSYVGGLVGWQDGGTITASWATGDADCSATGGVDVGGLVGWQERGAITASWATGRVEGNDDAGGLVGYQEGTITASYATGNVGGGDSIDDVGGLVGYQRGGAITASYATGDVDGGAGESDSVGGLVGFQHTGTTITASYATGDVDGGDGSQDRVGGLVGTQHNGATITASYATGDMDGGAGSQDRVGGLVGIQRNTGTIIASYAFGDADGGTDGEDSVGALVGAQDAGGSITRRSWGFGSISREERTGPKGESTAPDGITSPETITEGTSDGTWNAFSSKTRSAWSFSNAGQPPMLAYADYDGTGTGGGAFHCAGVADAPSGAVIIPNCGKLIPALVPANLEGNEVDINVASAATGTAYVAVLADRADAPTAATIRAATEGIGSVVSDVNGAVTSGMRAVFSLDGLKGGTLYSAYIVIESGGILGRVMRVNLPVTPLAVPDLINVADTASLVAGSRASIVFTNEDSGELSQNPNGCMVSPALPAGLRVSPTTDLDTCQISGVPTAASSGTYTVTATNAMGDDATPATVSITVTVPSGGTDVDGDGLIEISTLVQLNNVRHSLDGAGYKTSATDKPVAIGCPSTGCIGYELVADLTFVKGSDGDTTTWDRRVDGTVNLDTGDEEEVYFVIAANGASGGWVPIGDSRNSFTAVFEGNGHTITGLATMRDLQYIGLFGYTNGAEIRNLGLVRNLARKIGTGTAHVGGLVGEQRGGSIVASYATGDADGGAGDSDLVGGLVGSKFGGAIVASYATGSANGGDGNNDEVGGLVGNPDRRLHHRLLRHRKRKRRRRHQRPSRRLGGP